MSVNRVFLLGNLGKDPKAFGTEDTKSICRLAVATNEVQKTTEGEKVENTEWHNVVVYGKQAELCSKFLEKGSKVYLEGKLRTRKWVDDRGNNRYTTEIVANRVEFLTKKNVDFSAKTPEIDNRSVSPVSDVLNYTEVSE